SQRTRRYETATQQAALQQMRNPFRVAHVALAPRYLFQMDWVHQQQREPALEDIPYRFPQHTGRLQGHVRHAQRYKVVCQRSEIPGHRAEAADLLEQFPGLLLASDGALNHLEMYVQPGYFGEQRVHGAPPKEARL